MGFRNRSLKTLVEKYDRPVPRYTSYPTAAQFRDGIPLKTVHGWLKELSPQEPISLYVHLPFCPSLCWYCGCNMRVTHSNNLMQDYLTALHDEVDFVTQKLPAQMKVSTLHLGGGTPTYYEASDLTGLLDLLRKRFDVLPDAEVSLEIDPRRFDAGMARALQHAGVNRVSLGVQDTNPLVQEAIGRNQSLDQTTMAFQYLREAGITAINADLIYGLPLQTIISITQTAKEVAELKPSRIALYGYAHVPWMKPHQKMLERHPIPVGLERMEMFTAAAEVLKGHGYIAVGIDHFALPDDPLTLASSRKQLRRNFMGYTTDSAATILAFGVSAISSYPQGYIQNTTSIKDYLHQIRQKTLPIWKGLQMTIPDRCASRIIESLLCQFEADVPQIAGEYSLRPEALETNTLNLHQMVADGLVVGNKEQTIRITEQGRPFARVVASCFDSYLKSGEQKHSRL